MLIGKAAKKSNVGVETIRFYERKGLIEQPLKPKNGGYRDYSEPLVRRIIFIRCAQRLGFSLTEIADLLSLKAEGNALCVDVRDRAASKLNEVKNKIANLEKIQNALEKLIEICPGKGASNNCSILETLDNGGLLLDPLNEGDQYDCPETKS